MSFFGSYLSAHTKQNLSIHSISENGRKPVKKFLPVQRYFTLKVEVNLHTIELLFPITVKVTEPLRFFFCRFLLESAVGLFLICGIVLPPLSI